VPSAPVSDEARKRNGSLPGMGGVFNYVNLHVYNYAANNPVKYTDPDGEKIFDVSRTLLMQSSEEKLGKGESLIKNEGCVLTAYTRIASAIAGREITLDDANALAIANEYYTDLDLLSPENGAKLITDLVGDSNITVEYTGSISPRTLSGAVRSVYSLDNNSSELYATGRLRTTDQNGNAIDHTVNINSGAAVTGSNPNIKLNDTSSAGRRQLHNDPSGRPNVLQHIDVFKVTRSQVEL